MTYDPRSMKYQCSDCKGECEDCKNRSEIRFKLFFREMINEHHPDVIIIGDSLWYPKDNTIVPRLSIGYLEYDMEEDEDAKIHFHGTVDPLKFTYTASLADPNSFDKIMKAIEAGKRVMDQAWKEKPDSNILHYKPRGMC